MSDHFPPGGAAATPMLSRAAWARIVPFATYLAFIVVADVLERLGVSAASLRWLYALKVGAVLVTLIMYWRDYTELQRWRVSPIQAGTAVAAGLLVLVLWVSLTASWMVIGTPGGFDPRTAGQIDWLMVCVRIAGAALVVPVMEELFWRSFLMRWLDDVNFERVDPRGVKPVSVLITVLLFAFEHNQWLAGIVAGLAYSLLYLRDRQLWSAIVAHAVTNLVLGLWIVRYEMWTYW